MTQRELDCEVARATGESLDTISGMGFVPLTVGPMEWEPDDCSAREPLTVHWDELDQNRMVLFPV